MSLSQKKTQAVYDAIHEQIIRKRIAIHNTNTIPKSDKVALDEMMFKLTGDIWEDVKKVIE